jgi:hypothetical protein
MRSLIALLLLCSCGDDWQEKDTPGSLTYTTVWAFAPDDVWVGGSLVLHWDGSNFTPRPPPRTTALQFWGRAPNDLWAVDGSGVIRWQGSAWTDVPFGSVTVSGGVQAIFGLSATDVWAGGGINGEMLHWNGTGWTKYITQVVEVKSIWGAATDDVYVVGEFGVSHWDGRTFTEVTLPNAAKPDVVWGFNAHDIWAVGSFETLLHYDGVRWTEMTTDVDHVSIWGAAPNDVWAGGENGEISHWDGSSWSESMLGVTKHLNAIHGSSAADVWMVGYDIRDRVGLVWKKSQ